ncbi:MAG TPA: S-layer homology domain-containing protein, partial [Candidatus Cryosericum sp.]|nr:S-layer homology domain-containing protein [Candidatus Cryosericum sp.]
MKRRVSLMLVAALLVTVVAPMWSVTAAGFKDVPSDYWAATEIAWLADNKVASGYTDGTFRPEGKVSRE